MFRALCVDKGVEDDDADRKEYMRGNLRCNGMTEEDEKSVFSRTHPCHMIACVKPLE